MSDGALPTLISRYLRRTGAANFKAPIKTIRLIQRGKMRLAPDKPWLPFTAHQQINATAVEFAWRAKIKQAPLLWMSVVDAYKQGHGQLKAS